jgi:hypothetical protein
MKRSYRGAKLMSMNWMRELGLTVASDRRNEASFDMESAIPAELCLALDVTTA